MSQQQLTSLARQAAERQLHAAEQAVEAAVLRAVGRWLDGVRFLILREAADHLGVTAAGYSNPARAVDAVTGAWDDWARTVDDDVLPAVGIAFGEGFRQQQRSDPDGSYRPESAYMQTVHDRFKIWPDGAFEEVRPELVEALAEAETIDQIRDRVGRILTIDKDTRAIKADINRVEDRLMRDDLDPHTRKALVAERRRLWQEHDADLSRWQWKARRIARTEAHGAVNAGQITAARRRAAETGETLHKRWLGTADKRTRMSHRIADGQIVELDGKFNVGGAHLDFPGEAGGPAHEVINCRCSMRIEDSVTLQEQLQGPGGSLGEVRPGGVRLGPDTDDAIGQAVAKFSRGTTSPRLLVQGDPITVDAPTSAQPPRLVPAVADFAEQVAPAATPDEYFSPHEKSVADRLRDTGGLSIVSVDRTKHRGLPAAAAGVAGAAAWTTLDISRSGSPTVAALAETIGAGSTRSRVVVVDAPDGMSREDAADAISRAVAQHGADLVQVVVLLGDLPLVWTRPPDLSASAVGY